MQDDIRKELCRIAKANGGVLTAEAVVAAAKSERSPLHCKFNWNVAEAAHEYWLSQAGDLIRVYEVQIREVKKEKHEIAVSSRVSKSGFPEWTPLPREEGGGYVLTESVFDGGEMELKIVRSEFERALGHVERFIGYLNRSERRELADKIRRAFDAVGKAIDCEEESKLAAA